MKILTIKTDSEESEIGWYEDHRQINHKKWLAHKQLTATILQEINNLVENPDKIEGIVVFEGPGSFTGLRIGVTVANTLAYADEAKLIAACGEDWINEGIQKLLAGTDEKLVLPFYGSEANITKPLK